MKHYLRNISLSSEFFLYILHGGVQIIHLLKRHIFWFLFLAISHLVRQVYFLILLSNSSFHLILILTVTLPSDSIRLFLIWQCSCETITLRRIFCYFSLVIIFWRNLEFFFPVRNLSPSFRFLLITQIAHLLSVPL